MHETTLTWKDTNILITRICVLRKKWRKIMIARLLSTSRACAHPGRSCDLYNQLGKKLVTCLVPSLVRARNKGTYRIELPPSVKHPQSQNLDSRILLIHRLLATTCKLTYRCNFSPALLQSTSLGLALVPLLVVSVSS